MSQYDIIKQPVISEKAYAGMERGVYSFWVDPKATKTEIKSAVQQVFGVTVVGISTMNVPGKRKRVGRFVGQRADRKKAIVRLAEGQTIQALEGQA
ncbi:50S ribosomal protein L23 [Deinococcus metallilatus]|uniref:Large ribosomal subunit protein uL23 n=2 Tax=Deinococcus TaxID=1298 RepID=A0AAJ5K366_9DEIO|nr:50S ribosomal protein L23 [Deinococcus metallilatus]MBB5296903.1 large subunit ribosomal protein L23 [Deinococcus metallilatus]QBY09633.1 50S ribosomal protein L23 [Deinococcus metallilatus]RXJ09124.1 50S ribosomal protein L23 [Deinococcus metallilatus]TLK20909.1 50S ribosomal protein L23 [Deinococcus metallilatus]GMA13936.1 50S ribosomal protein L23 [Deinococcus metallilatus]